MNYTYYLIFLYGCCACINVSAGQEKKGLMGASELTFTPPWLAMGMPPVGMWDYDASYTVGYWVLKPEYQDDLLPAEYVDAYQHYVNKRNQRWQNGLN